MAVDMFLKLDGIKGESKDHKHKDEIHIESFSWGLSQTGAHGAGRRRWCRQGHRARHFHHQVRRQGVARTDVGLLPAASTSRKG